MVSPFLLQPLRSEAEARAMTDQSAAQPTPWYWESVKDPGYIHEHTLEGPDVLCRYWHDIPPSADALLIAAAPETAAERDRLAASNERLVNALQGVPLSQESCWGRSEARHYCPDCGEYGETPLAIRHNDDCCVPAIRAALDQARQS